MTDNILLYRLAQHKETTKGAEILDRIKASFDKWKKQKITDANLHSIYKDIEDILDEYELEEAMEAEG